MEIQTEKFMSTQFLKQKKWLMKKCTVKTLKLPRRQKRLNFEIFEALMDNETTIDPAEYNLPKPKKK